MEIHWGNEQYDLKKEKEKKILKKQKVLKIIALGVESAPVDGVGLAPYDVFLVEGACACVLVNGARSPLPERQCSLQ